MVKKLFLSLGLSSLLVSGLMACHPHGCTPGFWKTGNHSDKWIRSPYDPYDQYVDVFELDDEDGPLDAAALKVTAMMSDVNVKAYKKLIGMSEGAPLELGEALWLKGNDDQFKQLVRSSVAALLNIYAFQGQYVQYGDEWLMPSVLKELVQGALTGTGPLNAEQLHKMLDDANNQIDYVGDNDVCPN